ncbi:DUF3035 domain-containing protein [Aurantiacibacter sp. MUD61]|uniref:DUF3035 domain-containing protein n=1 Tax=Aurantiacibacter sp. MUD61 TaxID=3009083 RepID=UPI0022EFF8BA|nr:DUF3035 domain-containing protein [Aurantiacibacter sp. MUD61]
MAKFTRIIILATAATGLTACGGIDVASRERPDEFAVQRQAPLVIPPDFHMVPPEPGAPRPVEGTASEQALEALFGGPAARSEVETSALEAAGMAEPGIRTAVGFPDTFTVDKGLDVRTILAAPEGNGQSAQAVIPS